jgi:iron complex transport system ATP-binding protein
MSRLHAENLTVRRGGRAILDRVSLTAEGEGLTAVIGANGAGKSTRLSCLAGLLTPDQGEARLDGKPVLAWRPSELARLRAFVPQNPRCEWPIATERLVALGLTPLLPAFGGLTAALEARVGAALAACDLTLKAAQPATTLSGGELARAMLARALVGDPAVLIVDELTAGLDPRHALDALRRMKALGAQGRLVIASIHDLTLAARHADRIVALKAGRIVADGPTREVLTPELLKEVFDVEARIAETDQGPLVDLVSPA